jgi:hypothetical protein
MDRVFHVPAGGSDPTQLRDRVLTHEARSRSWLYNLGCRILAANLLKAFVLPRIAQEGQAQTHCSDICHHATKDSAALKHNYFNCSFISA